MNNIKILSIFAVSLSAVAIVVLGYSSFASAETVRGHDSFFSRVANILAIQEEDLDNAFMQAREEHIEEMLASGEITEEQASRMLEEEGVHRFGPKMRHRRGGFHTEESKVEMLEFLGVDESSMREFRGSGKTLLEIAEEQGIGQTQIEEFLKGQILENLESTFGEDKITQEEYDEKVSKVDEFVWDILNRTREWARENHKFDRIADQIER